jgi:hypothetical protein
LKSVQTSTTAPDQQFAHISMLQGHACHYIINDAMTGGDDVPTVVTINRPDVVALIEQAANKLTAGNKTEAVSLAMRRLLEQHARAGTLFGAHPGSVRVRAGVDLVTAGLDDELDAATGRELAR